MVLHTGAAIAPPALALAHAPQPALPGAGDIVAPKPIEPTVLGLAPERLLFSQLGLSERVVLTLQNVSATSMLLLWIQVGRVPDLVFGTSG